MLKKLLTTTLFLLTLLFTSLSTPVHSQTQETQEIGNSKTPINLKKVGGGVGVDGRDITKAIDNLNDTEFDKFVEGVKDAGQREKLKQYREQLSFCGLTPKVAKSNFNPFGGVSVYADGGGGNNIGNVCALLYHGNSHWKQRHIDISDSDLRQRVLNDFRPPKNRTTPSTKFDGYDLIEIKGFIKQAIDSPDGQNKITTMLNGSGNSTSSDFDLGKKIGYGYRTANGINLERLDGLSKIRVVVKKDGDKGYVLTAFPIP